MLYFKIDDNDSVIAIADDMPAELKTTNGYKLWSRQMDGTRHAGWLNRNDMPDLNYAQMIAAGASTFTGERYIAIDSGPDVAPRFNVIRAPAVGDDVSMAFNGDYYPVGQITKISQSLKQVTTSSGRKFYRRGTGGAWIYKGCFALIPGTIERLNPEF
jgi:hypothetical protein